MADTQPGPFELWQEAGGDPERYRQLLAEHGHLVPRPACTCGQDPHAAGCPRYRDNDRRPPCGWLPGEEIRAAPPPTDTIPVRDGLL